MKRARILRKRHSLRRIAAIGVVALALDGLCTAAFAYWTSPGFGTATATAGTLNSVTVDSVVFTGRLRPGTSIPVSVTVTNTNAFSVTIFSLGAGAVTSDKAGCGPSASGVTLSGLSGAAGTVLANGSTTLNIITATMPPTAASACQGATFSTQLDLVVRK